MMDIAHLKYLSKQGIPLSNSAWITFHQCLHLLHIWLDPARDVVFQGPSRDLDPPGSISVSALSWSTISDKILYDVLLGPLYCLCVKFVSSWTGAKMATKAGKYVTRLNCNFSTLLISLVKIMSKRKKNSKYFIRHRRNNEVGESALWPFTRVPWLKSTILHSDQTRPPDSRLALALDSFTN